MTTTVLNHRSAAAVAAPVTHHRTNKIGGVNIFYREAGPADAPVVLLLHGFPTSSHMFRNLIPALADRYHVIAPDYPGFGQSDMPDRATFAYTFDGFAELVDALLDQLQVTRYAMYVMDYGAPVGWRLALKHPERVTGLIVQNGNAYDEGLKGFWDPIKAYWADGSDAHRQALRGLVSPEVTKFQYTDGVADVSRISPDNWIHDQALLDRPGNAEIQLDIFYDYRTNLPLYPAVQAYFRERRPPALIVWGKNDKIFPADGAHPYKRDLPDAELHLLDTGHFALEDKADEIVPLIRDFLDRKVARKCSAQARTSLRPGRPYDRTRPPAREADMSGYSSDVAFTPTVKAIQIRKGSRRSYKCMEERGAWQTRITPDLARFIAAQTSIFLASANAEGQPYIQHRGGPPGFLRVLDGKTIGFADYAGNRQYITQGNLADNPQAHLFLIDYAHLRRIKIWGEARVVEDDGELIGKLMPDGYKARPEQAILFTVVAWDANCPQHIPQRFEAADVAAGLAERDRRIAALEAEVARLRADVSGKTADAEPSR